MEINKDTVREIIEAWKTLRQDDKSKNFKFDMFESAFSKTYSLLIEHRTDNSLDKQYVQLVSEAYLFANINSSMSDNTCLAACVLTERMLSSLAFSNTSNDAEISTAYILETREEIKLNFNDVNESISKLVKVYDKILLKN